MWGHRSKAWVAIEEQLFGNCEARALHLDVAFQTFVQGDLSDTEYCRQMKGMMTSLSDLEEPISDRTLVLNLLRDLNERGHLWTWVIFEELTKGWAPRSDTAAALYNSTPGGYALQPPSSTFVSGGSSLRLPAPPAFIAWFEVSPLSSPLYTARALATTSATATPLRSVLNPMV